MVKGVKLRRRLTFWPNQRRRRRWRKITIKVAWPSLFRLLGSAYFGCLAMIRALIFSYVDAGTIFLFSRSVFILYGRPSMIFCE
jgi:hypothetical protein